VTLVAEPAFATGCGPGGVPGTASHANKLVEETGLSFRESCHEGGKSEPLFNSLYSPLLVVFSYIFIYEMLIQPSMARMHSRKKGRSSSTHPIERKHPEWGTDPTKIEKTIVKLAQEGIPAALIGIRLRDSYGVPDIKAATGKKLSQILADNDLHPDVPEDLDTLLGKREKMRDHLSSNPHDIHNQRNLQLVEAKIRRLMKYYKREGRIPDTFSL
jgi:small subunit ribosomal protein S15